MTGSRQIKLGAVMSYAMIALNILAGLIYTPWILHVIGESPYGLYTLATSLISLFLVDFGLSFAVTRFVSVYRAKEQLTNINQFLGLVGKLYLLILVVIGVILACVYGKADVIYANLTAAELKSFKIVFLICAVSIVFCFPVNICNGILNAYEQYVPLKLADIMNKVGTIGLTVIALLNQGGLYALVAITGICNILTFLLKIILVKQMTPVKLDWKYFNVREMKEAFSFSAWTTVNALSQQMIFNIMPSILAMIVNTASIALFGFANVIEGYVYTISSAINGLFLPRVSREVSGADNAEGVLPLMIRIGRVNGSVIILLLIGLITMGREFVSLWVGDHFSDLYICIILMALPYYVSATQEIAYNSLVALNKIKYTAVINIVTGAVNLGLAYIAGSKLGVVGVCGTIGLTFWLQNIASNWVYKHILHIDIWTFFRKCHISLLPGTLLSGIIAWMVSAFIPSGGWAVFFLKAILIAGEYGIVMWLLGWNGEEKNLIRSILHGGR